MDWAKMMRDAYLAIGREYGATRRRSMPLADFAGFGPGALDVGAGSRGATGISRARAPPRGALRPRQEAHAPPPGDSVECEAAMLPFRDGTFHVEYLIAVIHHMPTPATSRPSPRPNA